MTRVAVQSGRARPLETLDLDALVLPLFEARVQPRGVAGHADWRLCGRIAKFLRHETFRGATDEVLLTSTAGRMGLGRVFLFGLGPPGPVSGPQMRERFTDILRVLVDAGARRHGIGFPVLPRVPPEAEHTEAATWAGAWLEAVAAWRMHIERAILLDDDGTLEASVASLKARARELGLAWAA